MSLDNFIALKNSLNFCPVCSQRLVEHDDNRAILVCTTDGEMFSIMGTTKGYRVETNIGKEETPSTCSRCNRNDTNVTLVDDVWVCTAWVAHPENFQLCQQQ